MFLPEDKPSPIHGLMITLVNLVVTLVLIGKIVSTVSTPAPVYHFVSQVKTILYRLRSQGFFAKRDCSLDEELCG